MADETTPNRSSIIQWVALAVLLAVGVVLFFRFSATSPPVVQLLAP